MYKYFGYSDVLSIEKFWKDVIPSAHSITITRSDKRSTVRYEKENDEWKVIGFKNISQVLPTRKLLDSLLFESNCGAAATIQ